MHLPTAILFFIFLPFIKVPLRTSLSKMAIVIWHVLECRCNDYNNCMSEKKKKIPCYAIILRIPNGYVWGAILHDMPFC
jgi:hypothetical protein